MDIEAVRVPEHLVGVVGDLVDDAVVALADVRKVGIVEGAAVVHVGRSAITATFGLRRYTLVCFAPKVIQRLDLCVLVQQTRHRR